MSELELDCLKVDCVKKYKYLDWSYVEEERRNYRAKHNLERIFLALKHKGQLVVEKAHDVRQIE